MTIGPIIILIIGLFCLRHTIKEVIRIRFEELENEQIEEIENDQNGELSFPERKKK